MVKPDYEFSEGEGAKATHTGFDCVEYTDFSTEIDLTEVGPFGSSASPARMICVLEAAPGTVLVVETQAKATRTVSGPRVLLFPIVCGINKIKTGTTVASVLVVW